MRRLALLGLLPLTACPAHAPAWYGLTDEAPATTGDPTAESATMGTPTTGDPTTGTTAPPEAASTSGELPEETSTGELPEETTGAPPNEPPQIFSVAFEPGDMTQAGPATLNLSATADVSEVEIAADGEVLATVPFEGFAYAFEVTSQAVCHGTKTFTITARDAEGLEDSATADLYCELPASGSEVYTTTLPGGSAAALALLPDDGVIVVGAVGGRMALWQLDAKGNVTASKKITDWSNDPDFHMLTSYATAVARGPSGAIFVGGVVVRPGGPTRYVVKLNAMHMQVGEYPGAQVGEEIAGLAVAADGTAVAAGRIRTSAPNDPPAYDAGIWGYGLNGPTWADAFGKLDADVNNEFSERAHAMLALPDGDVLMIGERQYKDEFFVEYTRAFWQRYASDGTRIGEPWTSPGKPFAHDAMRGGVVTADGFALAGWGRHSKPGSLTQVLVHQFDLAGDLDVSPPVLSPDAAQAFGVAQDREKKLVLAGYQTQQNVWTAWIFAMVGPAKPPGWEQVEPVAAANAIACGPWGRCTWVGVNAQGAVVSTRAP